MKFAYSILLLVFSVIILCEVAGIYFLYEYKNSLEDQLVRGSEKVDVMMVNRIDSYVVERMIDLTNFGKSGNFQAALEESNSAFSKMTDPGSYMDNMSAQWRSAPSDMTTPLMGSLMGSQPSAQLRQMQAFEIIKFGGRLYDDILMTNAYGANVIEMGRTADYVHYDEQWWKDAKNNGMYLGGLEFYNGTGRSSYVDAIQLNDENGNFIGVAKSVVDTQPIVKIVRGQMNWTDPIPYEYELIGPGSLVIYSSDPTEESGIVNHENDYSGQLAAPSGHFVQTIDGVDYLVTYSHSTNSKFSPLFDWVFVTKYKMSDVMKPVSDLSNLIIVIMVVLLVAISVTVFVLSERLARPIELVRRGLTDLNKGRANVIALQGQEEVRDLIGQFNTLVKRGPNPQEAGGRPDSKP